jgi:hypothetical protein
MKIFSSLFQRDIIPPPQIPPLYEYSKIPLDFGDLAQLNILASQGWRLVTIAPDKVRTNWAVLERISLKQP